MASLTLLRSYNPLEHVTPHVTTILLSPGRQSCPPHVTWHVANHVTRHVIWHVTRHATRHVTWHVTRHVTCQALRTLFATQLTVDLASPNST
jgi:hypothetical protein